MRDFWEDIEIIFFPKFGEIIPREQIQVSKNIPKDYQPDNTSFLTGFFPYGVALGYDPKSKVYLLVARDFRFPGALAFFSSTGKNWVRMGRRSSRSILLRIRSMGDVTIMCSDSSLPYNCTLAFTTDLSRPGVWLGNHEESRIWLLKFGIKSGNPPKLNFNFEEIETHYHSLLGAMIHTPAIILDDKSRIVRMLLQPYKRYDGRCSDLPWSNNWPCPDIVSHIHPYLPDFPWYYQSDWSIHSRYNGNIIYDIWKKEVLVRNC
jgi:hypothetical protein